MPDRFRKFSADELEVLYDAIETQARVYDDLDIDGPDLVKLYDEIQHERVQRKHRDHRELLPS